MSLPDDFWDDPPPPIQADPEAPPAFEEEGIFGPPPRGPLIGFIAVETIGMGIFNPKGITKLELTKEKPGDDAQDRNPSVSGTTTGE